MVNNKAFVAAVILICLSIFSLYFFCCLSQIDRSFFVSVLMLCVVCGITILHVPMNIYISG